MIKKLQRKSNKKGFTLVEIIVVLVILAILAAIAVPAVLGYINDAKDSKYIAEARSIYIVVQTEEAKVNANNEGVADADKTSVDYSEIAKTATSKTGLSVASVHENTDAAGTYTIKWNSDSKGITAVVKKNKEVTIKEKSSTQHTISTSTTGS